MTKQTPKTAKAAPKAEKLDVQVKPLKVRTGVRAGVVRKRAG